MTKGCSWIRIFELVCCSVSTKDERVHKVACGGGWSKKTTPVRFELTRSKSNGLAIHRLNVTATVSWFCASHSYNMDTRSWQLLKNLIASDWVINQITTTIYIYHNIIKYIMTIVNILSTEHEHFSWINKFNQKINQLLTR